MANCAGMPDLKQHIAASDERPFVSIIVPARNEERDIAAAVRSFCSQDYPNYEVIVIDDRSTDATPRILSELQRDFPQLLVAKSPGPPNGWLPKPFALQIGANAARGAWLLFVDADVQYDAGLLSRAMGLALARKTEMLVLDPRFIARGFGESLVIASLALSRMTEFSAKRINDPRDSRFAMGSGVFNLVTREALARSGGLAEVRGTTIDDVALGFRVKRAGGALLYAFAGDLIRIRMYHGFREALAGLTKTTFATLGGNTLFVTLRIMFGFLLHLLPYLALLPSLPSVARFAGVAALVQMHIVMLMVANRYRLPWHVVLTNPLRECVWWLVMLRSWYSVRAGRVIWRGRAVHSAAAQ